MPAWQLVELRLDDPDSAPVSPTGGAPVRRDLFSFWSDVLSGALDVIAGERQAAQVTPGDDISEDVMRESALIAKRLALRGHLREGITLARLLAAALDAPGARLTERGRATVATEYLETARLALIDAPDPALLASARKAGDDALAAARADGDTLVQEIATFRLGTLYLDPYTDGRNMDTYALQQAAWLRRGMGALELSPPGQYGAATDAMPVPAEALRTVIGYLQQSVAVRTGEYRGLALKALVQALVFLQAFDRSVTAPEIERAAAEALSLLPDERADARAFVARYLPRPTPPGPGAADAASATSPPAGPVAPSSTADRATALVMELDRVTSATLAAASRCAENWPSDPQAQAALRARLAGGGDSAPVRCALLLRLAEWSTATGVGPEEGLRCVDDAVAIDPSHIGASDEAIDYLRARLWFDQALVLERRAAPEQLALLLAYATATDLFHRVGFPEHAVEALDELTGRFPGASLSDGVQVLSSLVGTVLGLADLGDPETDRIVQNYEAVAAGQLMSVGAPPELVWLMCQTAKGTRLASVLALGRRSGLHVPQALQSELDGADGDEERLVAAGIDDYLGEEEDWLLVSYADTVEAAPSDTPLRQLRGRQRRLDDAWNHLLELPGQSTLRELRGLQAMLGEREMLLAMLPGAWQAQTYAQCCLLANRDAAYVQVVGSGFPYSDVAVELSGRTMRSSPNAAMIVALRESVQTDPGPDNATPEALAALDGSSRLGDLWQRIDEQLAAGRDHLLVAPHGPWHYVPWHLLGRDGRTLAERAAVSVLPSLALLEPANMTDLAIARLRRTPIASFGLAYRQVSDRGLGQLPEAEDEARAVAETFGAKAVLEAEATMTAVLDGLRTARYVHIAAHGRHNVDAASFQSILLAGSPGRLAAHRISACDLRGLALVTLSACETGLGRFDRGDNLRGIPAALLLSGVRSVIGTLWSVSSAAATVFFTALYGALSQGDQVANAYRTAQASTREALPAYADWGAFVLIGGRPEVYESPVTS